MELLKQGVAQPLSVDKEIVLLFLNNKGFLDNVAIADMARFEKELLESLAVKHSAEMDELRIKGVLSDAFAEQVLAIANSLIKTING